MHPTEHHLLRALCAVALAVTAPLTLAGSDTHPPARGAAPQQTHLPLLASADPTVVVKRQLRAHVRLPDGEMATVFAVEKGGEPAIGLRHGSTLSVSTRRPEGTYRTTYDAAHPGGTGHFVANAGLAGGEIDREPHEMPRPSALRTATQQDDPGTSLHFSVFVHDDIMLSADHIFDVHLAHWVQIMETLFLDREIFVSMYRHQPGLTDLAYGYETSINDWARAARDFHEPTLDEPGAAPASRKMLLVGGKTIFPGAVGIAQIRTWSAIASVSAGADTAAHEFGHLFGAAHENARRWGDPRLGNCVTIMWHEAGNTACRDYSLSNREVIQASGTF